MIIRLLLLLILVVASPMYGQADTPTNTPTDTPTSTPTRTNTPTQTYTNTPSCWENIVRAATPIAVYRLDDTGTQNGDPMDATVGTDGAYVGTGRTVGVEALLHTCDGSHAVDNNGDSATADNWIDTDYSDLTVSAVFSTTYAGASARRLVQRDGSFYLGMIDGKARCVIWTAAGATSLNDVDTTASDGSMHFVACVYDSVNLSLYRDGTFQASTPLTGNWSVPGATERVWYGASSGQELEATVDEIAIFYSDLTEEQLDWIYGSIGSCCATFTPTVTPTATPTNTPTITPVATNSCCDCGVGVNCVDPELYGAGWECPAACTPIPQAGCIEVPYCCDSSS